VRENMFEESSIEDDKQSILLRYWKAKRKLNLTPGLPEDTTYSMREFMHGLDPEMTSTQQSQYETTSTQQSNNFFTAAILNTENDDLFSSQISETVDMEKSSIGYNDNMSRTSSKKQKKKKKKSTIGF